MKVKACDKCKKDIDLGLISSSVYIKCKNCKKVYRLTQSSIKKEIIVPVIAVGSSVYISITFLRTSNYFIRAMFIIILASIIKYLLDILFIKLNILEYEEFEERK